MSSLHLVNPCPVIPTKGANGMLYLLVSFQTTTKE
ncbi:hypothetical protein ACP70R_026993 [Stipagrostis hirtigluma subsp. patula]